LTTEDLRAWTNAALGSLEHHYVPLIVRLDPRDPQEGPTMPVSQKVEDFD